MQNDIWLMEGDCLEKMKEIPDGSVDMILADLPYGTTMSCKWDIVIPFEPLWEQYWRVLKNNGVIVLFGREPFTSFLISSNVKDYRYSWIWKKNKPANISAARYQPMLYHEDIAVFYRQKATFNKQMIPRDPKGAARIRNGQKTGTSLKASFYEGLDSSTKNKEYDFKNYGIDVKNPSSILEFNRVYGGIHPCQKPIPILEYLIKTYTNESDTVLDNVMGSGSTGVACVNTSRKFIGIEKDEKYFQIARERIGEAILEKEDIFRSHL